MTPFSRTHPKRERGHKDARHHGKRTRIRKAREQTRDQSSAKDHFESTQEVFINRPPTGFIEDLTFRVAEAHFQRIDHLSVDDLAAHIKSDRHVRGLPLKIKPEKKEDSTIPSVRFYLRDHPGPLVITVPQIQNEVRLFLT